ncbi:hypothetical protein ANN_07005 [Periplaneta americana]|uniref:Endonuclease-reverse transcriptase n=1 Tax=Periplaneta americana TaxID=6978 RepID=A0ABQ8TH25_PERAM|nr:hypothetical protein ANN_07005 [Periplaneta americana]
MTQIQRKPRRPPGTSAAFSDRCHLYGNHVTNHNSRSEELTDSRQIHVEAELPRLFRIPRIPSRVTRIVAGLWQLCNVGTSGQDGIVRGDYVGSHNSEVEKFKYLGAPVTNINDTREEIKRRINMRNAYYYSVEKLLSSSLLSKNLKVRIYKTIILPVVLYGCETWTLTLREEQRLRVFENKVLTKIFVAKRDEVTGEWRKLHNAELHALYSSPDIIRNIKSRRLRWAGHVARMGESRNAYSIMSQSKSGVKRPPVDPDALKKAVGAVIAPPGNKI